MSFGPPADNIRAVYQRRGLTPPTLSTPYAPGALYPYHPRLLHMIYAKTHGYFWLPCILCQQPYGGHEIVDTIPDPINGEGFAITICPVCTADRNGGKP